VVHVAGMVDQAGRVLGTGELPAAAAGCRAVLAWMRGHGELVKAGVEGAGSYGAGLARYLAAALAALNGEASGTPKSGDGAAEPIRHAAGGPPRLGQGPHPGR